LCSATTLLKYGKGKAVVAILVSPVVDSWRNYLLVQEIKSKKTCVLLHHFQGLTSAGVFDGHGVVHFS